MELIRAAVTLHSLGSVALIVTCVGALIIVRKLSVTITTVADMIQQLAEGKR